MTHTRKPVEPWDTEKAAELAAEALRWPRPELPQCAGAGALREPEEAAYEAAVDADEVRYCEALRGYMKAGRNAALEIRKGAA
jgi:hypothetical protein